MYSTTMARELRLAARSSNGDSYSLEDLQTAGASLFSGGRHA